MSKSSTVVYVLSSSSVVSSVASKFLNFLNYRNKAARAVFEIVIFRVLYVFEKVFLKKNLLCSDRGFIRDRPWSVAVADICPVVNALVVFASRRIASILKQFILMTGWNFVHTNVFIRPLVESELLTSTAYRKDWSPETHLLGCQSYRTLSLWERFFPFLDVKLIGQFSSHSISLKRLDVRLIGHFRPENFPINMKS